MGSILLPHFKSHEPSQALVFDVAICSAPTGCRSFIISIAITSAISVKLSCNVIALIFNTVNTCGNPFLLYIGSAIPANNCRLQL